MSVHMGHTCRLMHALILLFASLLCTAKRLDPNQPHLTALTGHTTIPPPQQPWQSQSFHPNLSLLDADTIEPPNKIPDTHHHLSGSLWLTSKSAAPACLAVVSAQHASLASLPVRSSGLALLLMMFQFPLLPGSSFSCVQTATLRPASSRDSLKSWQVRHGLVTP